MPLCEPVPLRWLEDGDVELGVLLVIRLVPLVDSVEVRPEPVVVPVDVSVPPVLVVVSLCDAQPVISAAAANKAIRYFIVLSSYCQDEFSCTCMAAKMGASTL